MMFYTTVAGWMLHYFYMTAIGQLSGLNAEQVAGKFTEMLASPGVMTFWMVFVVVLSILVCAKGLQNGLERVTKVMMIALLAIMVVLAVNSLFIDVYKRQVLYYWAPVNQATYYLAYFLQYMVLMNVSLAVFNFIPVPQIGRAQV